MRIGIICAMEEELAEMAKVIGLVPITNYGYCGNDYHEYSYNGHTVIAVISGIGKVNAAITTQLMIDKFMPDKIINVGVAGSLSPELVFGDVVIADDLVEHDVDVRVFGIPLGQIPRCDVFSFATDNEIKQLVVSDLAIDTNKIVRGRIVSGDQFIDDPQQAQFLAQEFTAVACEMEGAAIAHVCYLNQVPVTVVRAVSDMAGQNGVAVHSFNEMKYMAANRAASVVAHLLKRV